MGSRVRQKWLARQRTSVFPWARSSTPVCSVVEIHNDTDAWYRAIDVGGDIRDGAWVAEAIDVVDSPNWPTDTRADPAQRTPGQR
jgi:hypothetical protein